MISSRTRAPRRWRDRRDQGDWGDRGDRGDQGFAMVELMVALVVFALLAAGVLVALNVANATGRSNRLRIVAANLAASQIETIRNTGLRNSDQDGLTCPLSGGSPPCAATLVGSNSFYVQQSVQAVPLDATASTCESRPSAKLAYRRVTVQVTWDAIGTAAPVRSDTLIRMESSATKANIAVGVKGQNGQPQAGVLVSVSPNGGSQQTGDDGCVVFSLPQGPTYTVRVNKIGYLDPDGVASPAQTIVTDAASGYETQKVDFDYDSAATLSLGVNTPDPAYPVPAGLSGVLPVTLGSTSQWASTDYRKAFLDCTSAGANPASCISPTGIPRRVSGLYPAAYSVWSGACADSDPGRSSRPAPIVMTSGQTVAGAVDLEAVKITVVNKTSAVVPNTEVYARPSCGLPSAYFLLGKTDSAGILQVSLPWGGWGLGADAGANATTVPLGPSRPLPTAATVRK